MEQGASGPITVPHYPQGMEVVPENELGPQDNSLNPQASGGWHTRPELQTMPQSRGFTGDLPVRMSRAVGTQSDFRESETQTGPWEPAVKAAAAPSAQQIGRSAAVAASGPEIALLRGMDLPTDTLPSQADVSSFSPYCPLFSNFSSPST